MGKKYIIEIIGGEEGDMDFSTIEPYTEPDLEQVRKEAYEQGRKDGKIEGQAETWVCVKKIALHPEEGGIAIGDIRKIFGCSHFQTVFRDYSASEAIEKIRQYEQEKEEQIQVGDEIETPSGLRGYVVNFTDDELVHYVSSEGRFGTMGISAVSKTGRHFPEIAEVLAKMKETDNG